MLKLWHCADARSFRVLWALEELQLEYELIMLPFPPRFEQREYLEENPLGTIPLLVDGDVRMTESAAMLHYLSTRHGAGRLSPAVTDPDYGAYLNWLHHGESTLTFPQTIYLRYTYLEPGDGGQAKVAEDYKRWFLARLRLLEATLDDGRLYILGETFSLADVSVGYAIQFALSLRMQEDLPPNSLAWYRRLEERSGFQAAKQKQHEAGMAQNVPHNTY
ncbi:glutathione S-transferase family protein [Planktotalea sp.]|uniref:glutathione S-transferase family protein n=1 Tax=Planktotalea sp. TaxID=2029877 RepID=UPI003299BE12